MTEKKSGFTRRDFIRGAAGIAIAGATAKPLLGSVPQEKKAETVEERPPEKKPARVVLIRDAEVIDENRKIDAEILSRMLDEGVKTLLEEKDTAAAWKRLIKPDDTVGIKSNEWRFLRTPIALEQALKERVMAVGVPEDKVSISDRGVLSDPVFQHSTALINTRPLRTHHWSGVGSLIKNYVMFTPKPWDWHDDSCADLAGLWDLPLCKGKTRLNILVMLTPLFYGKGPHHFNAKYLWPYKGLIIGTDPVAVDATGLRILEAQRKLHFQEDQPFTVPPKHITVAEKKFKLGVADPARIDLVKLGWDEDRLI